MANRLKEKYGSTALISGASAGIGQAFARDLASKGINLVVVARREERLSALKKELEQQYQISVTPIVKDLTLPRSAGDIFVALQEANIEIDILINNAGFGSFNKFYELERQRELAMVDLNCRVVVELTHLFLPAMVERKKGAIIIVSSVLGFIPRPTSATYAATKGFDLLFAESLYGELRKSGVDVLALCPGMTKTEFQQLADPQGKTRTMRYRTVEHVVESCWKALGKKPTVVDGFLHKLIVFIGQRLLSRKWLVKVMSR